MTYPVDTTSLEYRDGQRAGYDGYPLSVCQYEAGDPSKRDWCAGWLEGTLRRDEEQNIRNPDYDSNGRFIGTPRWENGYTP